jgi:hypothetical protein
VNTIIEVMFDDVVQTYHAWDLSIVGVMGASALAADGLSMTFTPDADLEPETRYTIDASVCTDAQMASFTTLTAPVDDLLIEGNTYVLPFGDLVFTEPSAADILLGGAATVDYVIVQVAAVDPMAQTISTVATTGYDAPSDITADCGTVIEPDPADFSTNPRFGVGPGDFAFPFGEDAELTIENFTLLGQFTPDLGAIEDIRVSGAIDVRPLGFGPCSFIAVLAGGTCVPCSDGLTECMAAEAYADLATLTDLVDLVDDCGL